MLKGKLNESRKSQTGIYSLKLQLEREKPYLLFVDAQMKRDKFL